MRRTKMINLHPSQKIVEAISGSYDPPGDIPLIRRLTPLTNEHPLSNLPTFPGLPHSVLGISHTGFVFESAADLADAEIWSQSVTPDGAVAQTHISYDPTMGMNLRLNAFGVPFAKAQFQSAYPVATLDDKNSTWFSSIIKVTGHVTFDIGLYTEKPIASMPAERTGFGFRLGTIHGDGSKTIQGMIYTNGDAVYIGGIQVADGALMELGIHYNGAANQVSFHVLTDITYTCLGVETLSGNQGVNPNDPHGLATISAGAWVGESGYINVYNIEVVDEKSE